MKNVKKCFDLSLLMTSYLVVIVTHCRQLFCQNVCTTTENRIGYNWEKHLLILGPVRHNNRTNISSYLRLSKRQLRAGFQVVNDH